MKPVILDTRSDCAAFKVFTPADSRFFSAMPRFCFVCCWATADSCGVTCRAIVGASNFSASFPVDAEGAVLTCGRGGEVRTLIIWSGDGGGSQFISGSGFSGRLLALRV